MGTPGPATTSRRIPCRPRAWPGPPRPPTGGARPLGVLAAPPPRKAPKGGRAPAAPRPPPLLSQARSERILPSVDARRAVEQGQGEIWVLLASPCATSSETSQTAGISALAMRTLAQKAKVLDGARIEAWVSAQGIGLLSHGPRLGPSEAPSRHLARVTSALGRALAGSQIADDDAAEAR